MQLLETIRSSWGWTGLKPEEVVAENDFGNLIVKDDTGSYWRICPEELSCTVIAEDKSSLETLTQDEEFREDWSMSNPLALAYEHVGPLAAGRKYCLKVPGILGGQYSAENLGSIGLVELIEFAGYVAHQIDDLPDGTKVNFRFDGDA